MIDKYLISNCLFIIDEFNDRYKGVSKEELKVIADTEFNEADLVVRLGYPFRTQANFNMNGCERDIEVKSKGFAMEVKYLRNFKSSFNTSTNKLRWKEAFEKDYTWLCNEFINEKKGKRAFILGWFNAYNRFSEIMQMGEGHGYIPKVNKERIDLFPFLNYDPKDGTTKSITYMYKEAFKPRQIRIIGYPDAYVDCMFLGTETDKFHFAMYY